MAFGYDNQGSMGLFFSDEIENNTGQSVLFVLPIPPDVNYHPIELSHYFVDKQIFFPFELNGEYLPLEAQVNFNELIFYIPKVNIEVVFEIDMETFFTSFWQKRYFISKQPNIFRYLGKHNIPSNYIFIPLIVVDLYKMDELYLKHKGIFVGLTPNFPNRNKVDEIAI